MLRLTGILVTLVTAIAVAALTWPGFFRIDGLFPVAQIISFRAPVVLALAGIAVLFLLLAVVRRVRAFAFAMTLVLLAGAAIGGVTLTSRGMGSTTLPEKDANSVRVMTWNTAGEATPPDDIARTAVAMSADIVTLPETTIEVGEKVAVQMRELGHPMWAFHTEYGVDGWAADSTTLLISPSLGEYSVIASSQNGTSNTSTVPSAVAMPVSGDGPIIVAAHAVAPRQSAMADWRHDLQWLADQCASANVIMAGDFNATVEHMARLGTDGGTLGRCHDAASVTGNGAVGTWPTSVPALLGAPIDHVMATSAWRATGSVVLTALDGSGSDHRPLIVQLERTSG